MTAKVPQHVLTIDVEDWFHCLEPDPNRWKRYDRRIEVGTDRLLELCERHGSKATFFVLGDVAVHAPELIRKIARQGHEIGSHGMHHRFIYRQTCEEFRAELRESIRLLESIVETPVRSFRAPYFSITSQSLWALRVLREEGIFYDSSIFPARNPRYGIPDAPRTPHQVEGDLWEWPLTVFPTRFGNIPFAGGVYFRFLPWRITKTLFHILESRLESMVIYTHPWELDFEQPRVRCASRFLHFRHYYDLRHTPQKLEMLLRQTRFVSLADGINAFQANAREAS